MRIRAWQVSLTSNFSPPAEVRFFLHLLQSGAISYERACESIEFSFSGVRERGVSVYLSPVELYKRLPR